MYNNAYLRGGILRLVYYPTHVGVQSMTMQLVLRDVDRQWMFERQFL